mgnify:CR=1 FL=1
MKLEYFDINGRALLPRCLFAYTNTEFEDYRLSMPDFGAKKAQGAYKFGQVPVMYMDDGKQMTQSMAIARYIAATFKGPNGENLYPIHEDPMLAYKIDMVISNLEPLQKEWVNFTIPFVPGYKDKDEHFIKFICKTYPEYLSKMEERFSTNGGKYILGN